MKARRGDARRGDAGFTMIEALVALALTGLVLSALATLTSQWLPNWNRGIDRIQQSELISTSLHRIAADLAAAEFVSANSTSKKPLFEGSAFSVTFVRTALGPNVGVGLDVVRINEGTDAGRLVTLRSRAPFAPFPPGASLSEQIQVADTVVMMRPPLRLSFAYAGPDLIFRDSWHDMDALPTAVMLTVRDAGSELVLSVSTATRVHVDAPARGGKSSNGSTNDDKDNTGNDGNKGNAPPPVPKQEGS